MEARQRTLFPLTYSLHPTDPHVQPEDKQRLAGQNAVILARLKAGPATNTELAELSLKYTSRLSDLRAAGYTVICHRGTGGVNVYELRE